ncbi:hypothetical protein QBE53_04475 [Vallitaleaceae bacterium 9-2]
MPKAGDIYTVAIKPSHIDWGNEPRNPTNRAKIEGESYVKIPVDYARMYNIRRGSEYTASFTNGSPSIRIKAAGNGTADGKYAKQFEGIGHGACKAFTPWYVSCGAQVGNSVQVKFTSPTDVSFTLL